MKIEKEAKVIARAKTVIDKLDGFQTFMSKNADSESQAIYTDSVMNCKREIQKGIDKSKEMITRSL